MAMRWVESQQRAAVLFTWCKLKKYAEEGKSENGNEVTQVQLSAEESVKFCKHIQGDTSENGNEVGQVSVESSRALYMVQLKKLRKTSLKMAMRLPKSS